MKAILDCFEAPKGPFLVSSTLTVGKELEDRLGALYFG